MNRLTRPTRFDIRGILFDVSLVDSCCSLASRRGVLKSVVFGDAKQGATVIPCNNPRFQHTPYGCRESISAFRNRLDLGRTVSKARKRLVQRAYMNVEITLLNKGVWPDQIQQILLEDDLASIRDKHGHDFQCLGRKIHQCGAASQHRPGWIEAEPIEFEYVRQ